MIINEPTWRELAATINAMGLRDQAQPVDIKLNTSSYVSFSTESRILLGASGLSLQLDVSDGLVLPCSTQVAEFACQIAGIGLMFSPDSGLWQWSVNGEASEDCHETRETAAMAAIRVYFPKADWLYQVESGDTELGYMQWALAKAFEDGFQLVQSENEPEAATHA